jgi:curved DNA-binding protein CbpA
MFALELPIRHRYRVSQPHSCFHTLSYRIQPLNHPTTTATMSERDYYNDLGLTQYATGIQIKAAYFDLAKKHHPDRSGDGDASAFRVVREAYEKLSDIGFKTEYDRKFRYKRMQFDINELTGTRTAEYEAEEAAREAKNDRAAAADHQRLPAYNQV